MKINIEGTPVVDTSSAAVDDKAGARKRRMQLRAHQRDHHYDSSSGSGSSNKKPRYDSDEFDDCSVASSTYHGGKPSLRGIKKQARYEPGVPMSREELTQWRKEARRVRNRESAAASRRKTRDRITQLEDDLQELQNKYTDALRLIAELEKQKKNQDSYQAFVPHKLHQSRSVSPTSSPLSSPTQSPISAIPSLSLSSSSISPLLPTSVSLDQVITVSSDDLSSQADSKDANGNVDTARSDVVHVMDGFNNSLSSPNTLRISRPTAA